MHTVKEVELIRAPRDGWVDGGIAVQLWLGG